MKIFGVKIDKISRKNLPEIFAKILDEKNFRVVSTVNPEFLVAARKNKKFKNALQKSFLNLCDGAGISILARVFGEKIPRISGVDTAEILCEICEKKNKKVFLIGGFGVAKKSAKFLQKKFPKLRVAAIDGDPQKLPPEILDFAPDAILVAFGAPQQNFWLEKFGPKIPNLRVGIGVGGTFDFWAKKIPRAPKILQKFGLEWLFRLAVQPRRALRIFRAVVIFPLLFFFEKIFGKIEK